MESTGISQFQRQTLSKIELKRLETQQNIEQIKSY